MKGFTIHSRSRFTGVTWGETNFGLPYFGVENFGFGDFKGDLFIGDLKRCVSRNCLQGTISRKIALSNLFSGENPNNGRGRGRFEGDTMLRFL